MFARIRRWPILFTRLLSAALLLGACGISALTPAAAQSPVVLRMARNAEPGVFIPWLIDDNTALFTMGNVYDGLLRVTKDGASVEPALATSWDTSADGLMWTLHGKTFRAPTLPVIVRGFRPSVQLTTVVTVL